MSWNSSRYYVPVRPCFYLFWCVCLSIPLTLTFHPHPHSHPSPQPTPPHSSKSPHICSPRVSPSNSLLDSFSVLTFLKGVKIFLSSSPKNSFDNHFYLFYPSSDYRFFSFSYYNGMSGSLPKSDSQRLPWHFNNWLCDAIGQWHRNGLELINTTLEGPSRNNT